MSDRRDKPRHMTVLPGAWTPGTGQVAAVLAGKGVVEAGYGLCCRALFAPAVPLTHP